MSDSTPADVRDVIVIGSGPAGYTAALYAARASLKPLVFEGSVTAGGALMNTTEVENFPGFRDGIMGPALMDEMRAQAERFGAELIPDDVTEVDLTGDIKIVKTDTETYRARSVILAMGSGYRKLGLAREDELSGRGVSWCATCDGFFFREQAHRGRRRRRLRHRGGDLPDPLRLEGLPRSTVATSCARPRSCRSAPSPTPSSRWSGTPRSPRSTATTGSSRSPCATPSTGETRPLEVTGLFIAIGHDPRSELLTGQVDLDDEGYVLVHHPSTHTNLEGVFAAGDLVDHHYRQAVTAAGTGCAAALDAERYLAALDHHASTAGSAERTAAELASADA